MPTYLVTGGAGFIGSHLAEFLVAQGGEVRILDDFSTGRRENIAPFLEQIVLFEGDLCDEELVARATKDADFVFHQAAIPSVARSVSEPLASNRANVEGTLNLLIASQKAKVKRLVYASSSSVYGSTGPLPRTEDLPPGPISPYGVSKVAGEFYCRVWSELFGLETVVLRYFNIFGPRQNPETQYAAVIPKFISAALDSQPPTIYGDGEQSRDFTYVENVVFANWLAIQSSSVSGQVFNVACGEQTTVNQLAGLINEVAGSNLKPVHTEQRPGDVPHSYADIARAKRLLGYEPRIDLKGGLRKTVEYFKKMRSCSSKT
jgi:UDP-glucose 4-epimerase